jgi:hypothetical protein
MILAYEKALMMTKETRRSGAALASGALGNTGFPVSN